MTAPDPLAELRFLVGRWRGVGTVRGRAVTSRSRCSEAAPGVLTLLVETVRDGGVVHAENVVFRAEPGGGVACTTDPAGPGRPAQEWRVTPDGGGAAWVLTHPGFVWTIRREGPDAFTESFDEAPAGGSVGRIVALRHERAEDPAG